MKNINRFSVEELEELSMILSEYESEHLMEEVLENMSGYLLGISLEYGFSDTEVRDWIHVYLEKRKRKDKSIEEIIVFNDDYEGSVINSDFNKIGLDTVEEANLKSIDGEILFFDEGPIEVIEDENLKED